MARASTSGARSRTPFPTCGSFAPIRIRSASSGSSTFRPGRSATRPSRRCAELSPATKSRSGRRSRPAAQHPTASRRSLPGPATRSPGLRRWSRGCGPGLGCCRCRSSSTRSSRRRATARCWPTDRRTARNAGRTCSSCARSPRATTTCRRRTPSTASWRRPLSSQTRTPTKARPTRSRSSPSTLPRVSSSRSCSSPASRKASSRTVDRSTTRRSWRRSADSPTSGSRGPSDGCTSRMPRGGCSAAWASCPSHRASCWRSPRS